MNKTSKVKKLISVAVVPGGYIHRWRRPLLGSVWITPGGAAGVPEALPEASAAAASVHRAVPNATAEHHAQDHLEDHDHSDHDGRDANEVQFSREELVNLPMAVLLEQISDDVAAGGTQAVLEHRGGQCHQRVGTTAVKRLVEGLHHGLGVVGVVVHDGLLQGLVIELLHILGDLVLVDKTPDAGGHLTGKEDHQAGEERAQQALGLLDGPVAAQEPNEGRKVTPKHKKK